MALGEVSTCQQRYEIIRAQRLFAAAVTAHMLEELLWLPGWSQEAGGWHEPVQSTEFAMATAAFLTVLHLGVSSGARGGPNSPGSHLTAGFALLMILNVAYPHLGATVTQRRYAPGLASALLLNLPASLRLLRRAFRSREFARRRFGVISVITVIASAVLWPLLFRIGRILIRSRP